jgi:hypothetical protein
MCLSGQLGPGIRLVAAIAALFVSALAAAAEAGRSHALLPEWLPLTHRASMDYAVMDGIIDSAEFAEAVRLWKAGSYQVDLTTAYGYAEGSGGPVGVRHSADTEEPYGILALPEIVRQAALHHAGGYREHLSGASSSFIPAWKASYPASLVPPTTATVHYVDAASTNPLPPFTSRLTAAQSIQDAIDSAEDHAIVWVLPGVYEAGSAAHTAGAARVVVQKAVSVISEAGPESTIIRGATNPAMRAVILDHPSSNLRGFTLRDGASGGAGTTPEQRSGGGMLGLKFREVADCLVENSTALPHGSGGGMAIINLQSSRVVRCAARNNRASNGGGVAVFWGFNLEMGQIELTGNTASQNGGGLFIDNARRIYSLLIADNQAGMVGGGAVLGSHSELWHATVEGNSAPSAGGVFFAGDLSSLINSLVCENPGGGVGVGDGKSGNGLRYSLVTGIIPSSLSSTGLVVGLPEYVASDLGDYRLRTTSAALLAGTTTPWLPLVYDLAGVARITGSMPDLGAYAFVDVQPILEPRSDYQAGFPVQMQLTASYQPGDQPAALGYRMRLPPSWRIVSAASANGGVAHTDQDILFTGTLTGSTVAVTISVETPALPTPEPVQIDADVYWPPCRPSF